MSDDRAAFERTAERLRKSATKGWQKITHEEAKNELRKILKRKGQL